jgi:excisionase family DNA binding protein
VSDVNETSITQKDLLDVEDVSAYLGVGPVTIYRWCREGRLPCLKLGRSWRIRREALEDFLRRGERPATLTGQVRSFLTVPDSVLGVVQNHELLHRVDAAFLQVGEARDGLLIKFTGGESTSETELRAELERNGLAVERLEKEGRFRFVQDRDPLNGRSEALRELVAETAGTGRTIWATFNWTEQINLDMALRQQEGLMKFVNEQQLVVKTAMLERVIDEWPSATLRRAQVAHSGVIWLSENGVIFSRVRPAAVGRSNGE